MTPHPGLGARFCESPWLYAEIYAGGGVYVCCPAWNGGRLIGNIFSDAPDEIWNGYQAQLFRTGILRGTFSQCDKTKCSRITGGTLPLKEGIRDEWLGDRLAAWIERSAVRLERGPAVVKLGYDSSCNLTCPSCRSGLIMAGASEREKLETILHQFVMPFLKDAEVLVMSSDGDPFASRHYRDVMRLTAEAYPKMRIGLCTHGVLLDRKAWADCRLAGRVDSVSVSIDAARPETYAVVRRGGDFERLRSNMEFLAALRRSGEIKELSLDFVVQAANFREMPEFVRLGREWGVDDLDFILIDHWDRGMDETQYSASKVWDPEHPEFAAFRTLLDDPIFDDPVVRLNGAAEIRRGRRPPALHVDFATGRISRSAS